VCVCVGCVLSASSSLTTMWLLFVEQKAWLWVFVPTWCVFCLIPLRFTEQTTKRAYSFCFVLFQSHKQQQQHTEKNKWNTN
jgi:hypothetical protein